MASESSMQRVILVVGERNTGKSTWIDLILRGTHSDGKHQRGNVVDRRVISFGLTDAPTQDNVIMREVTLRMHPCDPTVVQNVDDLMLDHDEQLVGVLVFVHRQDPLFPHKMANVRRLLDCPNVTCVAVASRCDLLPESCIQALRTRPLQGVPLCRGEPWFVDVSSKKDINVRLPFEIIRSHGTWRPQASRGRLTMKIRDQ